MRRTTKRSETLNIIPETVTSTKFEVYACCLFTDNEWWNFRFQTQSIHANSSRKMDLSLGITAYRALQTS